MISADFLSREEVRARALRWAQCGNHRALNKLANTLEGRAIDMQRIGWKSLAKSWADDHAYVAGVIEQMTRKKAA